MAVGRAGVQAVAVAERPGCGAAEELVGKDFTIPEYMEDAEKAIKKMRELRKVLGSI